MGPDLSCFFHDVETEKLILLVLQSKLSQTLKAEIAKINSEKKKLEDLEESLEQEEKVLEGIRDSLKDKTQVFHDKIQENLQPWTAQINAKQADIEVASSERDALSKRAESLKLQLRESEETLATLQSEYKSKGDQQTELRAEKGQLQKRIQEANKKLKVAQGNVQEWRGQAATTRNKVEEAKASQCENRSRNNVLDSLTRLKEGGKVEGLHGRLGNLGTIPDQYDVAISTACGGSLNNMVVDTVSQVHLHLIRSDPILITIFGKSFPGQKERHTSNLHHGSPLEKDNRKERGRTYHQRAQDPPKGGRVPFPGQTKVQGSAFRPRETSIPSRTSNSAESSSGICAERPSSLKREQNSTSPSLSSLYKYDIVHRDLKRLRALKTEPTSSRRRSGVDGARFMHRTHS